MQLLFLARDCFLGGIMITIALASLLAGVAATVGVGYAILLIAQYFVNLCVEGCADILFRMNLGRVLHRKEQMP